MLKLKPFKLPGRNLLSRPLISLLSVLILGSLACAFSGSSTSTPPTPASASSDLLIYTTPIYNVNLSPGESVPGTRLHYTDRNADVYNVTIDGLPATKQGGDSFAWQGVLAPGVGAKYDLRISPSFGNDTLIVGGPVEIIVLNPAPAEVATLPATTATGLYFSNIAIAVSVPVGELLPGTTLAYQGGTSQGASLSGTAGYPYRALGDSLIWAGQIRDNVFVRHNLRVVSFNDETIRLVGTAEIWIVTIR
jgi:hypothetical protein